MPCGKVDAIGTARAISVYAVLTRPITNVREPRAYVTYLQGVYVLALRQCIRYAPLLTMYARLL